MFASAYNETALFVTADRARRMCEKAFNRWPNISEATYLRRYSHGALLGYCILLKFHDGTLKEMSEAHAEELE